MAIHAQIYSCVFSGHPILRRHCCFQTNSMHVHTTLWMADISLSLLCVWFPFVCFNNVMYKHYFFICTNTGI